MADQNNSTPKEDATQDADSQIAESPCLLYQILTGVFGGLALILTITTIWMLVARRSGRTAPAQSIQGGFSFGALGSLMSTE